MIPTLLHRGIFFEEEEEEKGETSLMKTFIYLYMFKSHENNLVPFFSRVYLLLFHHQHLKALITCQGRRRKKGKKETTESFSFFWR